MRMRKITHKELVRIGDRWLRNQKRCGVVLPEVSVRGLPEEPDVIGWRKRGTKTILIECKASRSDFLSDKNKDHRHTGDAMGNWRYYLVPKDLVSRDEVPKGWGLLYFNGWGVKEVKRPSGRQLTPVGTKYESLMLYSELRRFHILLSGDRLNSSRNAKRAKALLEVYGMSTSDIPEYAADHGQQLSLDFGEKE